MALRELVTGSDVCTPGDGAGPSNAAGALADTLLGRGAKNQQRLRDVRSSGLTPVRGNFPCRCRSLLSLSEYNGVPPHSQPEFAIFPYAAAWSLWHRCRSVGAWGPTGTLSYQFCKGSS